MLPENKTKKEWKNAGKEDKPFWRYCGKNPDNTKNSLKEKKTTKR